VNHETLKRQLLNDPATREAYEHPPFPLILAHAVVMRRRALGLSQQELAERLGTSQTQIWRIESGQANPTLDTLVRLSEILGLDLEIGPTESPGGNPSLLPVR
jgi:transcriptional regulator with XRE-family HTH domain